MKPTLTLLTALLLAPLAAIAQPIRLHPQNPRVFEYRGKPLVLITATEHYGAVMNRPFRWEPYLDDLVDKKMNASRLFVLYRELQTAVNPYSTCKPKSLDYVSPYPRTGPGDARDRLPKYDLDQWNPEFFERLHGFLSAAEKRDIIVEITLLADHHKPEIWGLNPQQPLNNINKTPVIQPEEYITLRHPALWERQRAFVEKIVRECNRYGNVFYEICNEPQGNLPQQGGGSVLIDERQRTARNTKPNPTHEEIDEWQRAVAKVIRSTEASLPNEHLISGQPAYLAAPPYAQFVSEGFGGDMLDIVNVHQMHRTSYAGRFYDISRFMSRQLRLRELRDLFVASAGERKPLNMDEDNAASRFTNLEGWTIHRKRAWTTVLSGGHYDMIDFTIQNRPHNGLVSGGNLRDVAKRNGDLAAIYPDSKLDYIYVTDAAWRRLTNPTAFVVRPEYYGETGPQFEAAHSDHLPVLLDYAIAEPSALISTTNSQHSPRQKSP